MIRSGCLSSLAFNSFDSHWLVVSRSWDVCLHLSPRLRLWLWVSVFPSLPTHVSSSLAGFPDSFATQCLPIHLSPSLGQFGWWCVALGMSVFPCLPFSCLPVWLVVSGSLGACLHLHPSSCASQSGWWCPALWMWGAVLSFDLKASIITTSRGFSL